ncbi:LytR C-terminal domain-containing protein [Cellulomonas sp. ACRRI]|uniref:LytR C-terminal domain-containing protein n=1 Tax=Cellulomonas sp. ACRRI TaxID=2918188 RepID=UPI001EF337D0|nr:LytR C-terminal domain-containing protein [Cellulomonas sp. ACRRI]MCG7287567.1 LytR C-terminal domain-containing protein [Cellulomonas sp. ACRRI]
MTKASDRYPEDEFDAEPAPDAPIGVHRAPRSWWSRWWPFVAVVVLVPAVTVGLVVWASSWDGRLPGFGDSTEPAAAAPETSAPAEGTEDPATEDPAAEQPPATEEPPVVEEPAPTADLTTAVRVLNASGRSGLAGGAASDLEDAGFTSVEAGNGNAGGLQQSTVFYASADLAPTAQQVADTLGIANVVESAGTAPEGVVVLLLADFAG